VGMNPSASSCRELRPYVCSRVSMTLFHSNALMVAGRWAVQCLRRLSECSVAASKFSPGFACRSNERYGPTYANMWAKPFVVCVGPPPSNPTTRTNTYVRRVVRQRGRTRDSAGQFARRFGGSHQAGSVRPSSGLAIARTPDTPAGLRDRYQKEQILDPDDGAHLPAGGSRRAGV